MHHLILAAALVIGLGSGGAVEAQEPGESMGEVLDAAITEIVESREATAQRMQEIIDQIDVTTLEIEEANVVFDDMIATLRDQAALGDPDGELVQRIERLEAMASADAEAARLAGYSDLQDEFLEDAEGFRSQQQEAVGMWESLDRRIRGIEAERERVVFLIKLRRYDEAQGLIEEGIGELELVDARVEALERGLRESGGIVDD